MDQNKNSPLFQFPELRVVEASAGSGKTYALAYRYVQLLYHLSLRGQDLPLRRILAITFTNKAALEMKSRIISVLKRIALEDISLPASSEIEEQILRPFGIDKTTAQTTARKLMGDIIRHYHFFKVQTIDEFINSILVGCAFKLGLTANFRIRTDSRAYLEYSLEEFVDLAPHDARIMKLFVEFIDHYLFLENRAGWFPKRNILAILGDFYSIYNKYALDFVPSGVISGDIVKAKAAVLEQMKGLVELLPPDARLAKSVAKFLAQHPKGFDLDALGASFANEDIDLPKKYKLTAEMETRWAAIRMLLRKIAEEEACGIFDPYLHIFRSVQALLERHASADDIVLLDQLNSKARSLFEGSGITVEELYYRLAARYEHYLIDEFQDTSRLQWSNLSVLPEEALSHGGTLFYVGDKKQAIYRFRGGDVRLFDDVKGMLEAFPVNETLLDRNWRSQAAIVEWNNAVFSFDNLRRFIRSKEEDEKSRKLRHPVVFSEAEIGKALSAFRHSKQEPRTGYDKGYVRVEYVDGDKKEDRNSLTRERMTELIRDLQQRFALQDLTILTRKNSEVETVTRWLMEEGWMVNSDRTSDIRLHPLITEITSFLTFLSSPVDNLAFARFILGDLFASASGMPREHWEKFILLYRETLHGGDGVHLYIELRDKYPEIWTHCVEKFFKNIGLYPLYELIVSFYQCYECLERFPEAQGFLMHFIDLVKRQENENPDVRSFLDYFGTLEGDDAFVRITEPEAIRVMTVHKAKGLQFPVVILPFFGMEVEPGMQMSNNAANYVCRFRENGSGSDGISLVRLKKKYYDFSHSLYEIYREEYQEAFSAELNNLYVALTRAEFEMYIYMPQKIGGSLNIARLLVPEDLSEKGTAASYERPAVTSAGAEVSAIPPSLYSDWVDLIGEEFASADEFKNRKRKQLGKAMHSLLARIGNCEGIDTEALLREARSSVEEAYLPEEAGAAAARVKELLEEPSLRRLFFCPGKTVLNEQEIIDRSGRTRRIDRLIIGEDEVLIIDYKSTAPGKPEDKAQLAEYSELCKNLFKGKAVKTALVYLDTKGLWEP